VEKFAAASPTYSRDSHSLKMLWDNLKRKAKAAMAIQANNIYGTGNTCILHKLHDLVFLLIDIVSFT